MKFKSLVMIVCIVGNGRDKTMTWMKFMVLSKALLIIPSDWYRNQKFNLLNFQILKQLLREAFKRLVVCKTPSKNVKGYLCWDTCIYFEIYLLWFYRCVWASFIDSARCTFQDEKWKKKVTTGSSICRSAFTPVLEWLILLWKIGFLPYFCLEVKQQSLVFIVETQWEKKILPSLQG